MNVVELSHVTKRFGAVDGARLTSVSRSKPAEVVSLLGPNGAGKSTALAVLLGLRRADRGRVRLLGDEPASADRPTPGRRRAAGDRVPDDAAGSRADRSRPRPLRAPASDQCGRGPLRPCRPRGAAARRALGRRAPARRGRGSPLREAQGSSSWTSPRPASTESSREAVWDAIRAHAAEGGTILFTTHHLEEADTLATRVVVIERGAVVAEGTPIEIKRSAGLTRVAFRAAESVDVAGATRHGARLQILTSDAGATVEQLVRAGVLLLDLEVRPLTLEEALGARERRA